MYTENLVLCTQEIMYGESITSFSNFKGLLNHKKMLVCLFIVVWLLRAFKLLQFPSFSCKNATGSKQNPRLLEILLEIPLGVLADQQTRADID